ncbi:hypothetical protein GN956_G19920 [Arapaima gigas]
MTTEERKQNSREQPQGLQGQLASTSQAGCYYITLGRVRHFCWNLLERTGGGSGRCRASQQGPVQRSAIFVLLLVPRYTAECPLQQRSAQAEPRSHRFLFNQTVCVPVPAGRLAPRPRPHVTPPRCWQPRPG